MDKQGWYCVDGREAGVLQRLSVQSQQVQAEVYRSLRHMRLQRAQLQASLRQHRETGENDTELDQNGVRYSNIYK